MSQYELHIPFWIDVDAYSDRDRLMFVCGCEYIMICNALGCGKYVNKQAIHVENESRLRMFCGRMKIKYTIERYDDEWSLLTTENPNGRRTDSEVTEG